MNDLAWRGKWLEIRRDGRWEYAARVGDMAAAVIVAIDESGGAGPHILLVEQHRVPIGRQCLELPAGLVGDDTPGESLEDAAARELEEETGYRAELIERLGEFASSPGMTSETFTLVRATGLTKVGDGGGDAGEAITVHRVPLSEVAAFVAARREAGVAIDAKILLLLGTGLI